MVGWHAAVHGVAKSPTQLSDGNELKLPLSCHFKKRASQIEAYV